eukprot:scaffold62207_cov54-Phaeocystis_antarctica.AAC.2
MDVKIAQKCALADQCVKVSPEGKQEAIDDTVREASWSVWTPSAPACAPSTSWTTAAASPSNSTSTSMSTLGSSSVCSSSSRPIPSLRTIGATAYPNPAQHPTLTPTLTLTLTQARARARTLTLGVTTCATSAAHMPGTLTRASTSPTSANGCGPWTARIDAATRRLPSE